MLIRSMFCIKRLIINFASASNRRPFCMQSKYFLTNYKITKLCSYFLFGFKNSSAYSIPLGILFAFLVLYSWCILQNVFLKKFIYYCDRFYTHSRVWYLHAKVGKSANGILFEKIGLESLVLHNINMFLIQMEQEWKSKSIFLYLRT